MCDWEAEEYAEYLLWVEAEKARARARLRSAPEKTPAKTWFRVEIPLATAEA